MNVAYILNNTSAANGDTKAFLNLLQGVIARGVHPFVIMPDCNGICHDLQRNANVRTKTLNYRTCAYPRSRIAADYLFFLPKLLARIIVNRKATRQLADYLTANAIDLVHTNVGVVRIGFDAAKRCGIPHLYHIREYADKIGIHYFPTKAAFLRQLDSGHTYSACITKALQGYYRQSGNDRQSRVIYDGVFPAMPAMPAPQGDRCHFLFVGRIEPAKGLDQLLQAYKLYADHEDRPLPLKIAGSPTNLQYYRAQQDFLARHHLNRHVDFLGSRDDIAALMRQARALIVASPFEGFGFCMPEAQQQGCLVIARNTSGTKEQLDNALQLTGQEIALRYDTTQQLATLLAEVASRSADAYQPYTTRAFTVVNRLYTTEHHAEQTYQYYQHIVKAKKT